MANLAELTSVLRSKNAGALLCTMDLMFDDVETYERVRDCGVIDRALIARLYRVSENEGRDSCVRRRFCCCGPSGECYASVG